MDDVGGNPPPFLFFTPARHSRRLGAHERGPGGRILMSTLMTDLRYVLGACGNTYIMGLLGEVRKDSDKEGGIDES